MGNLQIRFSHTIPVLWNTAPMVGTTCTGPETHAVLHENCGIHDTCGIYCKTNGNVFTKYSFNNLNVWQVPLPLRPAFHTCYYILKKYKVVMAPWAHTDRWHNKVIVSEQEELETLWEDMLNHCGCSYKRVELATYKRDIINALVGMQHIWGSPMPCGKGSDMGDNWQSTIWEASWHFQPVYTDILATHWDKTPPV